ncbi:hypothetical protein D3C71_1819230 [compost metagenome]
MLHTVQRFVERGVAVQMIVKSIQHHLLIIRMKMFPPNVELCAQLFRLIAEHRSPAAIVDNQLPSGHVKLPQTQASAVQRSAELATGVTGQPCKPGVMLFQILNLLS